MEKLAFNLSVSLTIVAVLILIGATSSKLASIVNACSQRISSVEDADRIIVLDDGKINAIGTSEELLRTNKIYREVYTSQTKAGDHDEA